MSDVQLHGDAAALTRACGAREPFSHQYVLTQPVAAGTILRVAAESASIIGRCQVDAIYVAGSTEPLPLCFHFEHAEMMRDWDWHIYTRSMAMAQAPHDLPAGAVVTVTFSMTSDRKDAEAVGGCLMSGLAWSIRLGTVAELRDIPLTEISEKLTIRFINGPAAALEAYTRANGDLAVAYYDAFGNPAVPDATTLTLTGEEKCFTVETAAGQTATTIRHGWALAPGERIEVRDGQGRTATSTAVPRALDGTPIFFGEFHWHTEVSGDGERPLRDALTSARDELILDFAGPADHMNPTGSYMSPKLGTVTAVMQAEGCRPFDGETFATIPSAELSCRYGHANLVTDNFDTFIEVAERINGPAGEVWAREFEHGPTYPWNALIGACPPGRAMLVAHHTNTDSGTVVRPEDQRAYWGPMPWPLPADRAVVRLVEIVQSRGSFESELADPLWRCTSKGYGSSVQSALTRGYRLGFIAGTDNHSGWPARFNDTRVGLTAVIAPSLETGTLFQAMHQRRCYATSGARIVADATMNGMPMGSELRLHPNDPRDIRIVIRGTAPLTHVQIISAGVITADLPVDGDSCDFDGAWSDTRPGRPMDDTYYYVRARQADGHCVWLSPFWVDMEMG